VPHLYALMAMAVDLTHATAMATWGLGLPFLFWHRYERLTHWYTWFAVLFVVTTVASQVFLGECFLTTLARSLWQASGGFRDQTPFTVVLVNMLAGIRPRERTVVLLWELAILFTSLGSLWSWHRAHIRRSAKLAR
jgi:hypothetical protein